MGKPKEKKRANIKTMDQPVEKKENSFKSHERITEEANRLNNEIEKPTESYALNDLIASAEELLCDPGLVHDGDDTHPLAIAKKTLQRFIDRLKAI